jgi:hypothetical protein
VGNHLCNFREFECLDKDTEVEVYDAVEDKYLKITLDTMYKQLLKDEIDSKVIIQED